MSDDITLMHYIGKMGSTARRLYYYQGNFFHPLQLVGREIGETKRAMREFMKANIDRVKSDRANPENKNLWECFDDR